MHRGAALQRWLEKSPKLMNVAASGGCGFSELLEPINMQREITLTLATP
jgi:hypothetical protein